FRLEESHRNGHVDIPRMRKGGLGAQFFATCVDPDLPPDGWEQAARSTVESVIEAVEPLEQARIVLDGGEIRRAWQKGIISLMLSVEGGHVISSLSSLENFYRLGMRSLAVTWKNSNEMADSSEGIRRWGGLSGFGRDIVSEMDRLGVVIDCSHASRETFFDVIELSENPVLLSHSCAAAICNIPRNADDSQLRALADRGGVICINFFPAFLDEQSNREIMAVWSVYRRKKSELARRYGNDPHRAGSELLPGAMRKLDRIAMPTLERVADHIDHVVDIAGIDHVGLGSDFDGIPVTPVGLEDVSRLPALEKELSGRGYGPGELDMIMGGNLLRLVTTVCG
ncbi:MAG: dipeptidase, partial [Candidatus Krumholzibacteriota bacterium]